jgi:hypothetical protein
MLFHDGPALYMTPQFLITAEYWPILKHTLLETVYF